MRNETVEITDEYIFEFEGVGFAIDPDPFYFEKMGVFEEMDEEREDYVFDTDLYVDGELVSTQKLPVNYTLRRNTFFWKYQLPNGKHQVRIVLKNPTDKTSLQIQKIIIYDDQPRNLKH